MPGGDPYAKPICHNELIKLRLDQMKLAPARVEAVRIEANWHFLKKFFYSAFEAQKGLSDASLGIRRRGLTCGRQHGAGEEQGRYEVPVAVGVVAQHGHAVVAGLQRAGQQLLEARVGHAAVVAQEVAPGRHQLPPQLLLVGQLDGGEDPGSEEQVEDVSEHEQREVQR